MEQRVVLSTLAAPSSNAAVLQRQALPIQTEAAPSAATVERVLNGILGASSNDLARRIDQELRKLANHQEDIRKVNTGLFGKKKSGYETDYSASLNELGRINISNVRVSSNTLSIKLDLFVPLSVRANGRARAYALDVKTLDVSASGRQFVEGRFQVEALIGATSKKYIVRVNSSDVKLKRLELDSIGRLGGEGARLLGNAVTGAIRQWKPQIIRNVQDALNNSVVAKARVSGDLERLVRAPRR